MGWSAYRLFQVYRYHPEATRRPQLTNGVGGRFLALLVHPVVARHRAVCSLRLHRLSIRADQHTRHHSQRTKPCSTDIIINNHTNDRLFLIPTDKTCSTETIINVTITILKTDSSSFPLRQNLQHRNHHQCHHHNTEDRLCLIPTATKPAAQKPSSTSPSQY